MSFLVNIFSTLRIRLVLFFGGVGAIFRFIGFGFSALGGGEGTLKQRLAASFTSPIGLRSGFAFLRAFLPNLRLSAKVIKCYDNSGTAIVARGRDVEEVLSNDEDFEVVYGPRMAEITAGSNFFLGMQNTPIYTRDVSNMRLAVRRADVPDIVKPFAEQCAANLVAATSGRIDVPQDLTLRVPAQLMDRYFGTPGPSERQMIEWTTIMFWYLFADLGADPDVGKRARDAALQCRAYLDARIALRKSNPVAVDDILNRCLAMQVAGLPGMDDLGIRNNLIGLIIGAIPTNSKSAVLALDQLLDRPQMLACAQDAARTNNDALLAAYVFEALRFNPMSPVVYRRAIHDTVVARSTLRAKSLSKGTMVLASTLSAMFDPARVRAPNEFRTDRPWSDYMLWGFGLHTCFGDYMNRVTIPAMLKPLLKKSNLRRAAGAAGKIDSAGTPFPAHFVVEFDA